VHELVLTGAEVVDGTASPRRRADVGISGGRITEVGAPGSLSGARRIDATGLVAAPGFIDAHVHLDAVLLSDPLYEAGLRQGVTTVVLGQDGMGYAPASPSTLEYMRVYCAGINGALGTADWTTTAGYLARLDKKTSVNVAYLVPHGCLRIEAMGLADRLATDGELATMQRLLADAMREGAVGYSTGLSYVPASYSDARELVALGKAVRPFGGVFATHMRDYVTHIAGAFDETFAVGREAGIRVHVSHLNMHADQGLQPIDAARAAGVAVTFDTYPYLAGLTLLTRYLPGWALEGGPEATAAALGAPAMRDKLRLHIEDPGQRWDDRRLVAIGAAAYAKYEGLPPAVAAARAGRSLTDFLCDVLLASDMDVSILGYRHDRQNEEDMRALMAHPAHVFGSDGIYRGSNPHPRGYGTFARALSSYVREQGTLRLEEAVRHMTSSPASIFGLGDRGRLKTGMSADLVLFNPKTVTDMATYERGGAFATGIEYVLVNGVLAIDAGTVTGALSGRALRPS
jgi:N-acyl-D-amino-acid deacylase